MKKIILLSTAAVLLSPIAAKANQKSSILVGGTFALERQLTGSSKDVGGEEVLKKFEGENYLSFGLEAYYTYKVWNGLQIAPGLRALYAPEHTFEASKNMPKLLNSFVVEPRFLLGYEVQLGSNVTLTPFAGFGFEWTIDKEKKADGKDEWKFDKWKVTAVAGARFAYSNFYAALAGRFDVTASDLPKGTLAEAPTYRNGGVEVSIGAEF
jgi:opacity protein-like surface antigen